MCAQRHLTCSRVVRVLVGVTCQGLLPVRLLHLQDHKRVLLPGAAQAVRRKAAWDKNRNKAPTLQKQKLTIQRVSLLLFLSNLKDTFLP